MRFTDLKMAVTTRSKRNADSRFGGAVAGGCYNHLQLFSWERPVEPDQSESPRPHREHADLTLLLKRMQSGDAGATDVLASAVYDDLLAMARSHFRRDFRSAHAGHTLQPTMLANDTLMKLIRQRGEYDNSGHFFA